MRSAAHVTGTRLHVVYSVLRVSTAQCQASSPGSSRTTCSFNLHTISMENMNETRFSSEGYHVPKPMINIVGRPMILWLLDNLKFQPEDTLWIGIQRSLSADFAVEARLRREYQSLDLRLVFLDFQTRGAAETLFIMLQHMTSEELQRKTISLDCDTIYFSDILGDFRDGAPECGCSFYFEDGDTKPIFSYICFESGTKNIVDIREKVAISRYANTGAYAFPCGEQVRRACCEVLDNPVGKAGEFYTSTIIKGMIHEGKKFVGIHVPDFWCVGTPVQLHTFLDAVRTGKVLPRHKARFCFDLDRTLLSVSSRRGEDDDVLRVKLLGRNLRLLQELKIAGHHIIVETLREKLDRVDSSADYVISGPGALTVKSLREMGICFDEIVFGKPVADVYVSGRAGNIHGDIEKEVGWRLECSSDQDGFSASKDNFVATRSFNKITRLDDKHIVKSGPFEFLRGELHFYRSIPPALSHFFPRLVDDNVNPGVESPSITITRIDGVSYSHLVTSQCVTRGRFLKLLHGLAAIHTARKPSSAAAPGVMKTTQGLLIPMAPASEPVRWPTCPERSPEDLHPFTLCANLHQKVSCRLKCNSSSYDGFQGVDVPAMSEAVLSYLRNYQEGGRCRQAGFVHGDPVFSNCLLTKESSVIFVDMRGLLGELMCTTGDVHYDLSKVYQSLCGYDFIILDREMDATAAKNLCDLKENTFWPFVRKHYPNTLPLDIEVLAASHFLSILPLHEDRRHQTQFLSVCQDILMANNLLPPVSVVLSESTETV